MQPTEHQRGIAEMFKSKEHRIYYYNLKKDYEVLEAAASELVTELSEYSWDNLVEKFWGEIQYCVTQEWFNNPRVQKRIDNHEMAGSLESLIGVIDFYMWAERIPHCLYEAYEGYYKDEMAGDPEDTREWIIDKIAGHNPRERLSIYLRWNGVTNWDQQIFDFLLDSPLTKN